jgi:hypothetical protein
MGVVDARPQFDRAVRKRVGERLRRQSQDGAAEQMRRRAREVEEHAENVRALLLSGVGANET